MDTFLDNAQRIFEVARTGQEEFALVIGQDGGLHFFMDASGAAYAGASNAYRVTRSREGVRVEGKSFGRDCVLQQRNVRAELFRDQVLYLTASPVS